jgi:hypothetical protein
VGLLPLETVETGLQALLATFDEKLGFWTQSAMDSEPYRAILHAAQPLIALAKYLEVTPWARVERIHASILAGALYRSAGPNQPVSFYPLWRI